MSHLDTLKSAASLNDLAAILGYTPKSLAYIVYKIPDAVKYTKFSIPKRSGGERQIAAPCDQLKQLQRRLANVLYACRDQIETETLRRPLSHGFRKRLSIVTNARQHKRRRFVFNVDIANFFPSFNFGRVRGYFISNNSFKLNESVATVVAQIACFENQLPQGSPCSPVISDLIAHLLDIRLAQLAKNHKVTYSRYADDLTFSTSQLCFPSSIAKPVSEDNPPWTAGSDLAKAVRRAGFELNATKTRMQFAVSRQQLTGLIVNDKVNTSAEYYRCARAMCWSLFGTGEYYKPSRDDVPITSMKPLEGVLSHIHFVKDSIDIRTEVDKRKSSTAARRLFAKFLKYKTFVRNELPLIVCEGKTDSIYLKCAIRSRTEFHPRLGEMREGVFTSTVSYFNYSNRAHKILELDGGAGDLHYFFIKRRYHEDIQRFRHRPLTHPVIVLIDNDDSAPKIFSVIKQNFGLTIELKSDESFYHITDNLYLVKTPELGSTGASYIENFFEASLLEAKIEGKTFKLHKEHKSETEYGKFLFAEKVVRPNAATINFEGFVPLLSRIVAVLEDYKPPSTTT